MSHGGIIESLAGAVTADRLGFNASIALSLGFFLWLAAMTTVMMMT